MPLKIGPVQWYIIGSLKAAAAQAKDEEIDSTNHEIARLKKQRKADVASNVEDLFEYPYRPPRKALGAMHLSQTHLGRSP